MGDLRKINAKIKNSQKSFNFDSNKAKLMDTREILKKELNEMPDNLLEELYDYMKYLKYKKYMERDKTETAYASEKVLNKDWDNPEEDWAWRNL